MANNIERRKKDSAKLIWDTKPKRAPSPKDIEFQTAEVVIPNPHRDQAKLPTYSDGDIAEYEIEKEKMNRLIWGDNLLAMQALLAQGYEGRINLIYIDPPFHSGADYSAKMTIGGESITKEPSVIERIAYKDTWTGGVDSYLDMLYPRLQLMKRLLAENGSIYVHLDWHVGHYVKVMMDEIFGREMFINEVVWRKLSTPKAQTIGFGNVHDCILIYSRSEKVKFNQLKREHREEYLKQMYRYIEEDTGRRYRLHDFTQKGQGPARRFGDKILEPPSGKHWIWTQEKIDEGMKRGLIIFSKTGTPQVKRYLDEVKGHVVDDIWEDVKPIGSVSLERTDFDTQKPIALLERIIKASSNEGDLVADFFCGSGTTLAAAEKLNRRWIGCDFGKVAIQITRNRLVNQDAKPFLIENIGNYQRHMIYLTGGRINEMQRIILKLYGATIRKDRADLGVRKSEEDGIDELIYVSYPDRPITAKKAEELEKIAESLDGKGYKRLVILGWDYEYNYDQLLKKRRTLSRRQWKTKIISKMIPPEVYEYLKKAKSEEDIENFRKKIVFHEKPYLHLLDPKIEKIGSDKAKVTIEIGKYVVFDYPIEKEKERLAVMEIAKDNFASLIDYWAVDWSYDGVTFKSQWQAFRGFGKRVKTVPVKTTHELEKGKKYNIAVRVVDIFGNDATGIVTADLRML
ncbi:MAG TPA: site-specific DNA-methyltransferase [Thermococcus sp.]|nr:site-specific DNA-methyltransferase [Thermococcus sp.]